MIRHVIESLAVHAAHLRARAVRDEEGVTAMEYGLIAALVAVVIIAALTAVGLSLEGIFETVAGALGTASD